MEYANCDLCGMDEYTVLYRKPDDWLWLNSFEYPVVQCKHCGLVYVNPRPVLDSMNYFYPPTFYEGRNDDNSRARYEKEIAFLPSLYNKRPRVLDIGCANGDFLIALKKVYPEAELYGCDFFSQGISDPSIKFSKALLTDCQYSEDYFDLITAWAVFEHLHEPMKYFLSVFKILQSGGKFVFLVTNADSLYGRYAYKEDVPRHLYHFSRKTLNLYAQKCGFKLNNIYYNNSIYDGRGHGTVRHVLEKVSGVTWSHICNNNLNILQRIFVRAGNLIDNILFRYNWEARLGRSGIMVVEFEKVNAGFGA